MTTAMLDLSFCTGDNCGVPVVDATRHYRHKTMCKSCGKAKTKAERNPGSSGEGRIYRTTLGKELLPGKDGWWKCGDYHVYRSPSGKFSLLHKGLPVEKCTTLSRCKALIDENSVNGRSYYTWSYSTNSQAFIGKYWVRVINSWAGFGDEPFVGSKTVQEYTNNEYHCPDNRNYSNSHKELSLQEVMTQYFLRDDWGGPNFSMPVTKV